MLGDMKFTMVALCSWWCIAACIASPTSSSVAVEVAVDMNGVTANTFDENSTTAHECISSTPTSCYQLHKASVTRPHPNIIPLHMKTTACSAKFISLSSRRLDMYWVSSVAEYHTEYIFQTYYCPYCLHLYWNMSIKYLTCRISGWRQGWHPPGLAGSWCNHHHKFIWNAYILLYRGGK